MSLEHKCHGYFLELTRTNHNQQIRICIYLENIHKNFIWNNNVIGTQITWILSRDNYNQSNKETYFDETDKLICKLSVLLDHGVSVPV